MSTRYPKRLRLTITEEHAKAGKRKNYCSCPVALAMRSRFPDSCAGVFVPKNSTAFVEVLPFTANAIGYKPTAQLDRLLRAFDHRSGGAAASRVALVGTYTLTRIDP